MSKDCTNSGCACTPNTGVCCSVTGCANHCQDSEFCGLRTVRIGTHEQNPTQKQCVDCDSFQAG